MTTSGVRRGIIYYLMVLIMFSAIVYPPWNSTGRIGENRDVEDAGYSLIFTQPQSNSHGTSIDFQRLGLELAIPFTVCLALALTSNSYRKKRRFNKTGDLGNCYYNLQPIGSYGVPDFNKISQKNPIVEEVKTSANLTVQYADQTSEIAALKADIPEIETKNRMDTGTKPTTFGMILVKIRNFIFATLLIVWILYNLVFPFFRTTNETGPIGADMNGRQILIQKMRANMSNGDFTVTTEWDESSYLYRLLIQPPMRTTLKFKFTKGTTDLTVEHCNNLLEMEFDENALDIYDSDIELTESHSITKYEFNKFFRENKCKTMQDFFCTFGFTTLELENANGKRIYVPLKSGLRPNVLRAGD